MDEETLKKLDERLAKGEISEEVYQEIKSRYEEIDQEEEKDEENSKESQSQEERKKKKTEKEDEEDVELSGNSHIEGGKYRRFSASGDSRIDGDLEAKRGVLSGSTEIVGNANFERLYAKGRLNITGELNGDDLDLSGDSNIKGKVKAEKISTKGSADFEDNIQVEDMISYGSLKVLGDIEAEEFKTRGPFNIEGKLQASKIKLKIGEGPPRKPPMFAKKMGPVSKFKGGPKISSDGAYVKEIIGDFISIEGSGSGFPPMAPMKRTRRLKTESIEGTDIYLENTITDEVEGKRVDIGPSCKIKKVKAEEIKVHEDSTVKKKEVIDAD